jgi:hypothetical protein
MISAGYNVRMVGAFDVGTNSTPKSGQGCYGLPGRKIIEIAEDWSQNMFNFSATDFVLLHAGTNNLGNTDPGGMVAELDTLLTTAYYWTGPHTHVFLATIIGSANDGNNSLAQTSAWNQKIPEVVQRWSEKNHSISLVDMGANTSFCGLDSAAMHTCCAGGEHPTFATYEKMASVWFNAISTFLSE